MSLTPNEIVFHLQKYLPTYSDKFTTELTAPTATAAGTTVTVNSVGHGLQVGDPFVAFSGSFENLLTAVEDNGDGTARFTTAQEHDLTEPQQYADPTQLTLVDFGNVWDGDYTIVAIPDRFTFEIAFPDGETVLPALGTGKLQEVRSAGVVGNQIVATVIDVDNFTFEVTSVPSLPTGAVIGFGAVTRLRIYGAANIDRAQDLYNKEIKDDYALFVIMGDVDVSKNRETSNDATATFTPQNYQKMTVLNNFSTVVFFPTKDDIAGNAAVNDAHGDIYRALLAVLYGFQFEDDETALTYVTVSTGHGAGIYNSAFYTHVYDWQRPDVISAAQGFQLTPQVAFRDIDLTLLNKGDPEVKLTVNINLDDEPA